MAAPPQAGLFVLRASLHHLARTTGNAERKHRGDGRDALSSTWPRERIVERLGARETWHAVRGRSERRLQRLQLLLELLNLLWHELHQLLDLLQLLRQQLYQVLQLMELLRNELQQLLELVKLLLLKNMLVLLKLLQLLHLQRQNVQQLLNLLQRLRVRRLDAVRAVAGTVSAK